MASSRIVVTKRLSAFMSHICSHCGFPVISVIDIEARAEKTYSFSASNAESIANDKAGEAIEDEIQRIESCKNYILPLSKKEKKSSMIYPGCFCESKIIGFEASCPYCGNIEPWQTDNKALIKYIRNDRDRLFLDNYPHVFKKAEEAEKWAIDYIKNIIKEINEKRNSSENIKKNEDDAKDSIMRIKNWESQLSDIPELAVRTTIKTQLNELRTLYDEIGILNIKDKITVRKRIKILETKLRDVNLIIKNKSEPINTNISKEKLLLRYSQAVAFGCEENVCNIKMNNTYVYLFNPKDIPNYLIELIDNR